MNRVQVSAVVLRAVATAVCSLALSAQQQLELASPFVDDMILQRQMPLPVWGWAPPRTVVTVLFAGQKKSARADDRGRWNLRLDPLQASSKERVFVARGGESAITRSGVLVGEVWFSSGQSNMDWVASKSMCRDLANQLQRSTFDEPVREFNVDIGSSVYPRSRAACKDGWKRSRYAGGFSALSLAFAWKLYQELKVPIGILRATHGATGIETWTPYEGFANHPELQQIAEHIRSSNPSTSEGAEAYRRYYADLNAWQQASVARMARGGAALPRPRLPGIAEEWKGPSRMFNKKVAPLVPFAVRGVIWCQGTSNSGDGAIYAAKMKALVQGLRLVWKRPDLPFHFVQAPCYGDPDPTKVGFADLREAQRLYFSKAQNVGMALQYDLNPARPQGVHYYNKLDPGKRLARWALAKQYGKQIPFAGPVYQGHRVDGGTVTVEFAQPGLGQGLMVGTKGREADARKNPDAYVEPAREVVGGQLQDFQLAGADGKWFDAVARIAGQTVRVTADAVPEPVGVRYAYSASPMRANLYNRAGLPATPFAYYRGRQVFVARVASKTAKPKAQAPYVQVATIFRPGAVLQRDQAVPVWGFARAGAKITVRFAGQTKTAVAGAFEQWRVTLDPIGANVVGETLTVSCAAGPEVAVADVVVGDVWMLTGSTRVSGESFRKITPRPLPLVREFKIRTKARRFRTPRKRRMEIGGGKYRSFWKAATAAAPGFDTSVAGYHFATAVQEPGVPVGLLTLGADNPPLTWISYAGLQTAVGFEKERDELNLLYPDTRVGRAAVGGYIATLKEHNAKVAARLRTGEELPDAWAESVPAFPQPAYDQWARYVENATLTHNFCISPLTPMALRGVVWIPGPRNLGVAPGRYAAALEAWAMSLPQTFGTERVPFFYAHPGSSLEPKVGAVNLRGADPVLFKAWPKSLAKLAAELGERAARSKTPDLTPDPKRQPKKR